MSRHKQDPRKGFVLTDEDKKIIMDGYKQRKRVKEILAEIHENNEHVKPANITVYASKIGIARKIPRRVFVEREGFFDEDFYRRNVATI